MNRNLLKLVIAIIAIPSLINANTTTCCPKSSSELQLDSTRIAELDRFWKELSRTVREGDFEGYKAANHEDAVVVFTTSENKTSALISTQLSVWKQDFTDAKSGKRKNNVEFRFSQRIGSESTAHETGIFHYTSMDYNGKYIANSFIRFEALLVKRNGKWVMLMEYQKARATEEQWEALK